MILRLAVGLAVTLAAAGVHAQGMAKGDPAKGQKVASQVCAACHGADGNSTLPANPIIAGQHAPYLSKQLQEFKAAKERKNPIMQGMAAALSAEDMRDVSAYYATQRMRPAPAKDAALVAMGQKIYRGGNPATGVPACAGCHGPAGAGIPAQYPRISGQFPSYTAEQLKAFRAGVRANDPNRMMRGAAARMTDQEIAAVAEYLAGLR